MVLYRLFFLLPLFLPLLLSFRPPVLPFSPSAQSQAVAFIWPEKMGKRFTYHLSASVTASWSAAPPEETKLALENSIRATHNTFRLLWWCKPLFPALRWQRQEAVYEFKASLVFTMSSTTARDTQTLFGFLKKILFCLVVVLDWTQGPFPTR